MKKPQLILADLDGTLAVKWKNDLLPGRQAELRQLDRPVAIVTNQGGVHARAAWDARGDSKKASEYPTIERIKERVLAVSELIPQIKRAYAAFYVGHDGYAFPEDTTDVISTLSNGLEFHASWQPYWRKPSPGMLFQACCDMGVSPADALMLGDREDDRGAASRLGVPFIMVNSTMWESDFFDRAVDRQKNE